MTQFDRLFLFVMPGVNIALGLVGVLVGAPAGEMAWLCGFGIAGDVAIFGWSRLYTRLGRIGNAGLASLRESA